MLSNFNSSKVVYLQDRAEQFRRVRDFFYERQVMEVDCPILSTYASVDTHIDLIEALYNRMSTKYLHSSPEYGMKRLLAQGCKDIYQLSHVFRDSEFSVKHNPEFMMIEWYRLNFSLHDLIEETIKLIFLFLGTLQVTWMSYRETFLHYTGIDYVTATEDDLFSYITLNHIPFYPTIRQEGKDALLNLILGTKIEPLLGEQNLFILYHYPASQAALAQKQQIKDELIAERFEVYYKGIELANGYHELADIYEQRKRLEESNEQRHALGKKTLPIDEYFLQALLNLPDCSGVAVGFDRLMMLRHQLTSLSPILSWGWEEI